MAQTAFVTFDLARENLDYKTAYRILGDMGLHVTELEGNIYLPSTSVMGEVPDEWTAEFIRSSITEQFQAAGVNLTALFCALVTDYAGQGEKVDRQAMLAAALRNFGRQRR